MLLYKDRWVSARKVSASKTCTVRIDRDPTTVAEKSSVRTSLFQAYQACELELCGPEPLSLFENGSVSADRPQE